MIRLITFPMPSMCVFNGTAFAGGYFLGLCHDYRTMHATRGNGICLTELRIGVPLGPPYNIVLGAKLHPTVVTRASFGGVISREKALKDRMIDSTYET